MRSSRASRSFRNGAAEAVRDAEVVFEALPEVLDAKADALRWLGEHVDARATIASTTSTFVVTELQRHVAHPERMLNAHWLNPALLMPLVEISRSDATGQSVVDALAALLERVGKKPVICGPAPGYIVPRIQALAMNEAARMVEEGVASAEDIDTAIRTGFGPRFAVLGLLEFIDWGGCDILYYASTYLAGEIGPRFAPAASVVRNMETGRDGVRTGAGFHDYADVDVPRTCGSGSANSRGCSIIWDWRRCSTAGGATPRVARTTWSRALAVPRKRTRGTVSRCVRHPPSSARERKRRRPTRRTLTPYRRACRRRARRASRASRTASRRSRGRAQ